MYFPVISRVENNVLGWHLSVSLTQFVIWFFFPLGIREFIGKKGICTFSSLYRITACLPWSCMIILVIVILYYWSLDYHANIFLLKICEVGRKEEGFHQNTMRNDYSSPGLKYKLNTFKSSVVVQALSFLNCFFSHRKITIIWLKIMIRKVAVVFHIMIN